MQLDKLGLLFACTLAVSGCSAGGDGGGGNGSTGGTPSTSALFVPKPATGTPIANSTRTTTENPPPVSARQALTVFGFDRSSDALFTESATIIDGMTLSGSRLDGSVMYAATTSENSEIILSNGKSVAIKDNDVLNGFRFGNADMIGVAGTLATNVPSSGSATYLGSADVLVNDGGGSAKSLTSTSAIVNFSLGRVDVDINDGGSYWIKIDGATINGNAYANGSLSASPSFLTDPVTSGSLVHEGRFFGDDAGELGGVLLLDRTSGGIEFRAQGVYSGSDGS